MQASILEERNQDLLSFKSYHRCTKHQLYSVIGKLSFACNAIPAGSLVWQINTSLLIPRRIKSNTVHKELFASIRGVNNIGYTKVLFHCAARLLWNSIAHSNLALVCMLHFRLLDILILQVLTMSLLVFFLTFRSPIYNSTLHLYIAPLQDIISA